MMFSLVVSILIVYGLTLILVQGSIFDGIRNNIRAYKEKLYARRFPEDEELNSLIINKDKSINPRLLEIYSRLQNSITTNSNDKALELYDSTINSIKNKIVKSRNTLFAKTRYYIVEKFDKLIRCMMCMGFWVGVFISVLPLYLNINLFEHHFVLATKFDVSIFLLGCMFSGTTWAINSVVDLLDDIKNRS